jgi:DNA invertase Pin-like site-specific DNA recombinase
MLLAKGKAKMAIYGYARVSTRDQDLTAQDAELRAAGVAKVFKEKVSGASALNRPELAKLLRRLDEGDVLVVTRLDRLARSTRDLLNILDTLAERGASFKSLRDSWADTSTPSGKLMVTILAGLNEFERELIAVRTGEGIERAKIKGVKFGRPNKLTTHQRQEAVQRLQDGATQADVARTFNISESTVSRLVSAARPFGGGHEGALVQ